MKRRSSGMLAVMAWATAGLALSSTGQGCAKSETLAPPPDTSGEGGSDLGLSFGTVDDPVTCEDAAQQRSYLGCDYWPTVTFNSVWNIFDFAVVVANVGAEPADVTVAWRDGLLFTTTVQPLSVAKLTLPWVPELKGAEGDSCGSSPSPTASVLSSRGAYHLTSTRPVAVYQFNALQYRGAGGYEGKSWDSCPGHQLCEEFGGPAGCFSFTNDASILLPSTALTGNYRVIAPEGPAFLAITGTADGTNVQLQLPANAGALPGGGVDAGTLQTFSLNAGDVIQVAATGQLGGAIVAADRPVQVVAGASCAAIAPSGDGTCDHLEESVLPAETLGRRYLVAAPTGPLGAPSPYALRLYGNVDGTVLTYPSGAPANAPTTIDAGVVVDLGIQNGNFEIEGSAPFAIATFLPSSVVSNTPDTFVQHGDPAKSQVVAVEQYRNSYVFLAPDDYDVSFVDVIAPLGTAVTLDGKPMPGFEEPLGATGFGLTRVRLGSGQSGAHAIAADVPIGVQVVGYGSYTSYQYPAGMKLTAIAEPPPIE